MAPPSLHSDKGGGHAGVSLLKGVQASISKIKVYKCLDGAHTVWIRPQTEVVALSWTELCDRHVLHSRGMPHLWFPSRSRHPEHCLFFYKSDRRSGQTATSWAAPPPIPDLPHFLFYFITHREKQHFVMQRRMLCEDVRKYHVLIMGLLIRKFILVECRGAS